ncbi:DNA-3-methyladenine glycosylase family protein [Bacteroidota bacterium]
MIHKKINLAVNHLSKCDNTMLRIIKKYGKCNLEAHNKYFEALLKAIVGQQLSLQSADAIFSRFMRLYNGRPTSRKVLNTPENEMKEAGLSNAKIKYVKDLADKLITNKINLKNLVSRTDEEIITELTQVKGIGVWTVHMFLIFTLGRLNVLPYSDLGIKKAILLNYNLRKLPDEQKIIKLAQKNNWSPYNSIAALYLWKTLESK